MQPTHELWHETLSHATMWQPHSVMEAQVDTHGMWHGPLFHATMWHPLPKMPKTHEF